MSKIVIALGGNALQSKDSAPTAQGQLSVIKKTCERIADISQAGHELAIVHGNGPQIGRIILASETARDVTPVMPFDVCGAMSQGYIGYDIQNAIRAELLRRGIFKPVSTIITQVTVDPYDDAFHEPVKVIGRVLTEEEAELEEQKGNYVTKVEGGYRRIVAAPKPQDVVEIDAIRTLSDAGQIVIACGGGGIPVLEQQASLNGASAVIEKDLVSGKLAELLDAEELLILTSVEKVSLNYQSDKEEKIEKMDVKTAKKYMQENQFGASTMLPKVEAAVSFVEKKAGRKAVITSIDRAKDGFLGKTGTVIE